MQHHLSQIIGTPIRVAAPLSSYTTIGIGGPARYLAVVQSKEELKGALQAGKEANLDTLVLGEGSNVLFGDEGFPGLVIINKAREILLEETSVVVDSGALLSDVVHTTARNGLAGLAFAAGIPGTVGGALYGNAGAFGTAISHRLESATLINPDGSAQRTVGPEELDLRYRWSKLKETGDLVESMVLRLERGDPKEIWAEIEKNIEHREGRLPKLPETPSAGSFFKNLPPPSPGEHRVAAGKLLDECGCKGLRIGDAVVYEKHANIIVNRGRATASDVLRLSEEMKRRVQARFGVALEPEVRVFASEG